MQQRQPRSRAIGVAHLDRCWCEQEAEAEPKISRNSLDNLKVVEDITSFLGSDQREQPSVARAGFRTKGPQIGAIFPGHSPRRS